MSKWVKRTTPAGTEFEGNEVEVPSILSLVKLADKAGEPYELWEECEGGVGYCDALFIEYFLYDDVLYWSSYVQEGYYA